MRCNAHIAFVNIDFFKDLMHVLKAHLSVKVLNMVVSIPKKTLLN